VDGFTGFRPLQLLLTAAKMAQHILEPQQLVLSLAHTVHLHPQFIMLAGTVQEKCKGRATKKVTANPMTQTM
jgi:hypothetical protein